MIVNLPATWVAAGQGLPDICAAHGNPVVIRKQTRIESSPPGWVWALLPLGLLIFFIVRAAMRKAIVAPNWGFCRECIKSQLIRMFTGWALVAGGLILLGVSLATNRTTGPDVLLPIGLVLLIVGYVGVRISAGEVIARARLTRDGWFIEVRDPARNFQAQAQTTMAAALPQPVPR